MAPLDLTRASLAPQYVQEYFEMLRESIATCNLRPQDRCVYKFHLCDVGQGTNDDNLLIELSHQQVARLFA